VKCEPDVRIYLDGAFKGWTTEREGGLVVLDVPAGSHAIRLKKKGFEDREEHAEVRDGQTTVVVIGTFQEAGAPVPEAKDPGPGPEPVGILQFTALLRRSSAFEIPQASRDKQGNPVARGEGPGRGKEGDFVREVWLKNPCLELVLVFPGEYLMGCGKPMLDEQPVHKVTIAHYFYVGKYETTQEQWAALTKANPSRNRNPKHPVEQASWNEIRGFLAKLREACHPAGIGDPEVGWDFRLPSEAEWEYACRAGSPALEVGGQSEELRAGLEGICWFSGNSRRAPHPVGRKAGNAWGLFDTQGNVWEICEDAYVASYDDAPSDGRPRAGKEPDARRVIRGGSFSDEPFNCRTTGRLSVAPDERNATVGFRVVLGPVFRRDG
jgi:formylglycine-generating enzyme required for sulfatase activity